MYSEKDDALALVEAQPRVISFFWDGITPFLYKQRKVFLLTW